MLGPLLSAGRSGGGGAGEVLPPGEFVVEAARCGRGCPGAGPSPGTRWSWGRDRPGCRHGCLLAGGGQVLEQDPPGHGVDHQEVGGQQQDGLLLAAAAEQDARSGPAARSSLAWTWPSQAPMAAWPSWPGSLIPGQITALQQVRRAAGWAGCPAASAAPTARVNRIRSVMVGGEGGQRGTQDGRARGGRPVPVPSTGQRPAGPLTQEPALHRGHGGGLHRHRPWPAADTGLRQRGDGRVAEQVAAAG